MGSRLNGGETGHPLGWNFPEEIPLCLTVAVVVTAACTAVVCVVQFAFAAPEGSELAEISSQLPRIATIMAIVVVVLEPLAKVVVFSLV